MMTFEKFEDSPICIQENAVESVNDIYFDGTNNSIRLPVGAV